MTFLDTRELYSIFLESDWWINLSRKKRGMVGHCERCPSTDHLQSHHRFYRENWFDTLMEDLEVLCRPCHEKEHGISSTTVTVTVTVNQGMGYDQENWQSVKKARNNGLISRHEFLVLKARLMGTNPILGKRIGKKKHRKQKKIKHRQGCKPWFYSPRRTHWVNRGTSSN